MTPEISEINSGKRICFDLKRLKYKLNLDHV